MPAEPRATYVGGHPDHIDATGTRRRLQALAATGWRITDICDLLPLPGGIGSHAIGDLMTGHINRLAPVPAAAITDLYQHICYQTGPSRRARRRADAHGWPPADAWDDDTIDDPDTQPYPVEPDHIDDIAVYRTLSGDLDVARRLTDAERAEVVRIGTRRQLSAARLAELLDVEARTINRIRTSIGAAA